MPNATLTYLGHSTVLIETLTKKRVIIDPFLDGNPRCPDELKDPGPIDYILLTHGHGDHSSSAVSLAKKTGAVVCATFELATLLAKDGVPEGQLQFMNKGGRISLEEGLAVTLTNAFHSSSYQTADGATHYAGEPAGVVLELESGATVYHAGDTCLFGDMELIAERFKPVLALLPIGDRYTMGPRDAARAVELIKPKAAIPIHWGTFDALTGTPEEFSELLSKSPTKAVVLEPGGRYEIG